MTAPGLALVDEWAIVDQARTNPAAFAALYRAHRDGVHRYALRRVGHRELAEDITSETFTRALRRLDSVTYRGRGFGAWLITIARNLIVDHYKSSRTRREVTHDGLVELHAPPVPAALDAVEAAHTLSGCFAGLTELDRRVLVRRHLHGLSWAEVAAAEGCTVNAAKQQHHRAVERLRRNLNLDRQAVAS